MTGYARAVLVALAAAILLGGCTARAIKQDRAQQVAELGKVYVQAASDVPAPQVLDATLGTPELAEAGGLRFALYQVDYAQAHALQKQARKAARKAARRDDKEKLGPGHYIALALVAPIVLPALALSLPVTAADMAVGSAIVAAEGDDPRKKVTGVGALFVHDAEGNYRWHACCFRPDSFRAGPFDERGLNMRMIPYARRAEIRPEAMPQLDGFRRDYRLVQCLRAKAGDVVDQRHLFERFNATVPDPGGAYYWARVLADGEGAPVFLARVEARLAPDALEAAKAHYGAIPLASVDCAATADRLLQAETDGTKGPQS